MVNPTVEILRRTPACRTRPIDPRDCLAHGDPHHRQHHRVHVRCRRVGRRSTNDAMHVSIRRTFRRGICDLKLWPNVPPDVKHNSSTPGKIDTMATDDQTLVNQTAQNVKSSHSGPVIATANLQYNPKQITSKPLNITWNDDSAYPMLDELSRIAKVRWEDLFARPRCSSFLADQNSMRRSHDQPRMARSIDSGQGPHMLGQGTLEFEVHAAHDRILSNDDRRERMHSSVLRTGKSPRFSFVCTIGSSF